MGIIGDETLEIRCMIGPPLPSHIHFSYTQWALMGRGELRIFLKPLHSPVTFPWLCIFLTDTQTIALCRLSPTLLLCRCVAAGRACGTGPAHVPTSLSKRKQSSACLCPCPCPYTSTACYFQQPSTENEMGAQSMAGCPVSCQWGGLGLSGVKGKCSPSLASPTPERGCDRLNPRLMNSGRWLFLHIATYVKIAHSDFSHLKAHRHSRRG